jgi:hypothetical protein
MSYFPEPLATDTITLPPELEQLIERLAENAHHRWSRTRMDQGWVYGLHRNGDLKQHPCLIPYDQLPEHEKEVDRIIVRETVRAMILLGAEISVPTQGLN